MKFIYSVEFTGVENMRKEKSTGHFFPVIIGYFASSLTISKGLFSN